MPAHCSPRPYGSPFALCAQGRLSSGPNSLPANSSTTLPPLQDVARGLVTAHAGALFASSLRLTLRALRSGPALQLSKFVPDKFVFASSLRLTLRALRSGPALQLSEFAPGEFVDLSAATDRLLPALAAAQAALRRTGNDKTAPLHRQPGNRPEQTACRRGSAPQAARQFQFLSGAQVVSRRMQMVVPRQDVDVVAIETPRDRIQRVAAPARRRGDGAGASAASPGGGTGICADCRSSASATQRPSVHDCA